MAMMKLFILTILINSHPVWSISPDDNSFFGTTASIRPHQEVKSKLNNRVPSTDENNEIYNNKLLAAPKEADSKGEKREK